MMDLLVQFKKMLALSSGPERAASIKNVLPAFTALSYDGMVIGNGLDASSQYADFMQNSLPDANRETPF